MNSNPVAVTETLDIAPVSRKYILHIQANTDCRFILKLVDKMIRKYKIYRIDISTDNAAQSFGQID